jgi:hypothetical protein
MDTEQRREIGRHLDRYLPEDRRRDDHDSYGRETELVDAVTNVLWSGTDPQHVSAAEAVAALQLVPTVRRLAESQLDVQEVVLIEAAINRGVTWEQLGAEYGGRSRQAMQQHYRRLGGTRTWRQSAAAADDFVADRHADLDPNPSEANDR